MTNTFKEIQDMKADELIGKLSNVIRRTSLQLYDTSRDFSNVYIRNGAQDIKDIRLLANKRELRDAIDYMGEVFCVMRTLTRLSDEDVTDKTAYHIAGMMLRTDS